MLGDRLSALHALGELAAPSKVQAAYDEAITLARHLRQTEQPELKGSAFDAPAETTADAWIQRFSFAPRSLKALAK